MVIATGGTYKLQRLNSTHSPPIPCLSAENGVVVQQCFLPHFCGKFTTFKKCENMDSRIFFNFTPGKFKIHQHFDDNSQIFAKIFACGAILPSTPFKFMNSTNSNGTWNMKNTCSKIFTTLRIKTVVQQPKTRQTPIRPSMCVSSENSALFVVVAGTCTAGTYKIGTHWCVSICNCWYSDERFYDDLILWECAARFFPVPVVQTAEFRGKTVGISIST